MTEAERDIAALTLSLKRVVGKKYAGLFAIFVAFTGIEFLDNVLVDRVLAILFVINLAIYITIRFVKRRTNLLDVPSR